MPSSTSTSSSSSSSTSLRVAKGSWRAKKICQPPAIIHIQPPKVVHAKPQDFMKVVQLLTGNSPVPVDPPAPEACSPACSPSLSFCKASSPCMLRPVLDINVAYDEDQNCGEFSFW
ncbi:hypothetical protein HPP92_017082 [Vanilla planifolia]|uniref:VQ domain-containing protein n=1 Tax=Vanilla planifolia TaxID=51239 RepID=A0A835ULL9_VANPL|nr:hypothetical protein HPP92_017082 [Vanilla planifolia]